MTTILPTTCDAVTRTIRCRSCACELAQVETIPGVMISDADGLVCERRVTHDRQRIVFGPGWYPAPDGHWTYDNARLGERGTRDGAVVVLQLGWLVTAVRQALRPKRGTGRSEAHRHTGSIELVCPECASTNTIQTEETE